MRELLIGGLLAVGVAVALALYGDARDDTRQHQAEVLENTRFVRQAAMDPAVVLKPFRGMSLREAQLSGLPLGCPKGAEPRDTDAGCADLSFADLSGADLSGADLSGADLSDADLSDADLSDADLSGADLSFADLNNACHSATTHWPDRFEPDVGPSWKCRE